MTRFAGVFSNLYWCGVIREWCRERCTVGAGLEVEGRVTACPQSQKGRATMGRGRQKAKDAKIARQIKYTSHSGDIRELERELIGGAPAHTPVPVAAVVEVEDDLYDRWAEEDDED